MTGLGGEQCTATSKRSGDRCKRLVVGGGVCVMHGGNAPQVRVRREARILAAEAAQEAPVTAADAADVMLAAMNDSHGLLQRLKANIASGQVQVSDLSALGDWIDRAARISKMVADAGIEERRMKLTEGQGQLIALAIRQILDALGLSPDQQQLVPVVVPRILRSIGEAEAGR